MSGRLLIVAGHGRCGSSLAMQMLAAAGLRCAGSYPRFEHEAIAQQQEIPEGGFTREHEGPAAGWFANYDAVKILLPHRVNLTRAYPLEAACIWLDRNPEQQARSWLKTMRRAEPTYCANVPEAQILSTYRVLMARERELDIESLIPAPRIEMTFDDIVRFPLDSAESIREFAGTYGHNLDARKMAAVVIQRSPKCAPGFEMDRVESVH